MTRRRQGGQMIMMLALAFALFLFGIIVLVADSAYLYVWSERVQAAAQVAAQAGANSVDPHYLYGQSNHLVDLEGSGGLMAFERGCVQVGDESAELTTAAGQAETADAMQLKGNGVRCVSDGCAVYASVEKTVHLPLPLFGDSVVVRGVSYAAPVVGAATAAAAHCNRSAWVSADPASIP
ncbi:MAG: hypothetical protein M3019_06665 [Candidatus Dormibacteraeota bacterium]|nr:hypothetical protein [Candidatus Dormibacteraeota bacterium]